MDPKVIPISLFLTNEMGEEKVVIAYMLHNNKSILSTWYIHSTG